MNCSMCGGFQKVGSGVLGKGEWCPRCNGGGKEPAPDILDGTTPGPWRVEDGFYPSIKEIIGPSFAISIVMWATDLTESDYLRRIADARLIASAPELAAENAALKAENERLRGVLAEAVRWMKIAPVNTQAFWKYETAMEWTTFISRAEAALGEKKP